MFNHARANRQESNAREARALAAKQLKVAQEELSSCYKEIDSAKEILSDIVRQAAKKVEEVNLLNIESSRRVNELNARERCLSDREVALANKEKEKEVMFLSAKETLRQELDGLIAGINVAHATLEEINEQIKHGKRHVKKQAESADSVIRTLSIYKDKLDSTRKTASEEIEEHGKRLHEIREEILEATRKRDEIQSILSEESARIGTIAENISRREAECMQREKMVELWALRISGMLRDKFGSDIKL